MDARAPSDAAILEARRAETWGDWLLRDGGLPAARVRAALERRRIYGGGLDTALLELNVASETGVWARLASATGLPVPPPALCEAAEGAARETLPAEVTAPLRAAPVAVQDRVVRLFCTEPVDVDRIVAAAARAGLTAQLFIVPEVRLLVARSEVYGEPLPPRFASLASRTLGSRRVRRLGRRSAAAALEVAAPAALDGANADLDTAPRAAAAGAPPAPASSSAPVADERAVGPGPDASWRGDASEELNVATLWDDPGAQPAIPLEDDPPAPARRRASAQGRARRRSGHGQ